MVHVLWHCLYIPEKKRLSSRDVPLPHRLLQGPSEKVAKFFLRDGDVEEIGSDVCISSLLTALGVLLGGHSYRCLPCLLLVGWLSTFHFLFPFRNPFCTE